MLSYYSHQQLPRQPILDVRCSSLPPSISPAPHKNPRTPSLKTPPSPATSAVASTTSCTSTPTSLATITAPSTTSTAPNSLRFLPPGPPAPPPPACGPVSPDFYVAPPLPISTPPVAPPPPKTTSTPTSTTTTTTTRPPPPPLDNFMPIPCAMPPPRFNPPPPNPHTTVALVITTPPPHNPPPPMPLTNPHRRPLSPPQRPVMCMDVPPLPEIIGFPDPTYIPTKPPIMPHPVCGNVAPQHRIPRPPTTKTVCGPTPYRHKPPRTTKTAITKVPHRTTPTLPEDVDIPLMCGKVDERPEFFEDDDEPTSIPDILPPPVVKREPLPQLHPVAVPTPLSSLNLKQLATHLYEFLSHCDERFRCDGKVDESRMQLALARYLKYMQIGMSTLFVLASNLIQK